MHHFQNGEKARVLKHGVEVEVIVFRQLGEFVYAFDDGNRAYQFHVGEVLPIMVDSKEALNYRCDSDHAAYRENLPIRSP